MHLSCTVMGPQRYWGHDLDLLGSRDIIDHVIIGLVVGTFLLVVNNDHASILHGYGDTGLQRFWGHEFVFTVCIHFCRLLKPHFDLQLSLNGMPIPVIKKTKFLGLMFDRKLSFIPHFYYYLKEKCMKAINLLRLIMCYVDMAADIIRSEGSQITN